MRTIWKYELPENFDDFEIEMPKISQFLSVQAQYGKPVIWYLVDNTSIKIKRHFKVFGTGHPIDRHDSCGVYRGTFQLLDGNFIGHLYELFI